LEGFDLRAFFLRLTVFVGGVVSLAAEVAASRLVEPYFGSTIFVWATLIGLILAYLALGYYLGGWLIDKYPHESVFYRLAAWAGFFIGAVPLLSRPLLFRAATAFYEYELGLLAGLFVGVALLFLVPITLLGCLSPAAIRLSLRELSSAGQTAGSIYALSTLGSIIGAFLPPLVLIPAFGTRRTFFLLAFLLMGVSIAGLVRSLGARGIPYGLLVFPMVLALLLGPGGPLRPDQGLLYEAESAYNYIQVVQWGDDVYLRLNESYGVQSVYNPNEILSQGIWDYFLLAPFFNKSPFLASQVKSLCLIGLAGGTVARLYTRVYGPIPIDGVELDPLIIQVGRRFFAMDEPNLNAIADDGRRFLMRTDKTYDVIAVDAYRPPYIPFHLTTR